MVQTLSNIPLYSGVNNEITNGLSFSELSVSQLKSATTNILINDTAPTSNQVLVATSPSNAMWVNGSATSSGDSFIQTSIKTANYTASANDEVLVDCNSASANIYISMPASPANGTQVRVVLISQHTTRVCILSRNGSNWNGVTIALIEDEYTLVMNGDAVTLRFVNSTIGWIILMDALQPHHCQTKASTFVDKAANANIDNSFYNTIIIDNANLIQPTTYKMKIKRQGIYTMTHCLYFNSTIVINQCIPIYYDTFPTTSYNWHTWFKGNATPNGIYGCYAKGSCYAASNFLADTQSLNNSGAGTLRYSDGTCVLREIR
jgi:hypothetical protein